IIADRPSGSASKNDALRRRGEIDLLLHGLVHILRSHEDRDSRLHHAAGLGHDGGGSHVHVARQIENNDEVIAAKREIKRFELAAHLLGELFHHRSPFRAAFLEQALETLISVRTQHEIFWHDMSSSGPWRREIVRYISQSDCGTASFRLDIPLPARQACGRVSQDREVPMTITRRLALLGPATVALGATALSSTPARAAMKTESVDYSHGNIKLKAHVAYDDSVTGKRPAIFMVHARNGLTDFAKQQAEEWSKLG